MRLRLTFMSLKVYNFWEPLHYLDRGSGFQTWETSPVFAIRSYAYILLHGAPVRLARLIGHEKVSCLLFLHAEVAKI
jgi:alpha-1,2-mannosyltransferase